MQTIVLKYLIIALIIFGVIKYTTVINIDNEHALRMTLLSVLFILVLNLYIFKNTEHMTNSCTFKQEPITQINDDNNKDSEFKLMQNFDDHMMDFDKVKQVVEKQRYNNYTPNSYTNGPGFYLLNNCEYSDNTKVKAENQSGLDSQYSSLESKISLAVNYPELHTDYANAVNVGKDRGYLNWQHY